MLTSSTRPPGNNPLAPTAFMAEGRESCSIDAVHVLPLPGIGHRFVGRTVCSLASSSYSRLPFRVQVKVHLNVAIFRDITPCRPYVNRGFERKYHLHLQGKKTTKHKISVQHVTWHLLHAGFYTALHPSRWQHW